MRFILTPFGLEHVGEAPEPRSTHPVRLVLATTKNGDPDPLREVAYASVEDANTDLEYMGQYFEDIALVEVEGAAPSELGFDQAY